MPNKKTNNIKKLSRFNNLLKSKLVALLVIVLVAGIGSYLLVFSKAATPARPSYSYFGLQTGTGLHKTVNDSNWAFATGNFDGDGKPDFYAIKKVGASSTEVHILGSASAYKTFILQTGTPLHTTAGANYWFDVADFDGDKRDDLYLIKKNGQSTTEVHILSAKSNFQTWIAHSITALHKTDTDGNWRFKIGDFDADGRGDLYAIQTKGSNFKTDVHILAAKDNFQRFALQSNSVLHDTAHDAANWDFDTGNYDGDNRADLFAIKKNGSSNTEIHVLTASSNFNGFALQTGTGLHKTTADSNWNFTTSDYDKDGKADLFAIQKNGASSTEIHILASKYIAAVNDPAPAPSKTTSPTTTNTSSPANSSTPGSSPASAPSQGSASVNHTPSPTTGADCSYTHLIQGSRGTCVAKAQSLLNAKGFNAGGVDGAYGANTSAAVVRLKTKYNIYPCSVGSSINNQVWDVLHDRYIPVLGVSCSTSAAAATPRPATNTDYPYPGAAYSTDTNTNNYPDNRERLMCVHISPRKQGIPYPHNVLVTYSVGRIRVTSSVRLTSFERSASGSRGLSGCMNSKHKATSYTVTVTGFWVNIYQAN